MFKHKANLTRMNLYNPYVYDNYRLICSGKYIHEPIRYIKKGEECTKKHTVLNDESYLMIMVTLSLNFRILYRRQFGARVSPLHVGVVLPLAQFGALLPSSLPSTYWGHPPVGAATCATRAGRRSMPLRRLRLACLGRGVFWGVGAFSPPP